MSFQEFSHTLTVEAEQIEYEPRSVITPSGPVTAYPGQWEVRYPDGNVQVVDDDQFQETFLDDGDDEESTPYNETAIGDDSLSKSTETASSSPAGNTETATEGSSSTVTESDDSSTE